MKCPHCEYEDEIQGNPEGFQEGEHGDFYKVGVASRQHRKIPSLRQDVGVYGCPKCKKTFIDKTYY